MQQTKERWLMKSYHAYKEVLSMKTDKQLIVQHRKLAAAFKTLYGYYGNSEYHIGFTIHRDWADKYEERIQNQSTEKEWKDTYA